MGEAWEGWYCVAVMVLMFIALLKNVAGPDVLMLGALAAMLAANTVDITEGLKGFSNKGLLTVACLFVAGDLRGNTCPLSTLVGSFSGFRVLNQSINDGLT